MADAISPHRASSGRGTRYRTRLTATNLVAEPQRASSRVPWLDVSTAHLSRITLLTLLIGSAVLRFHLIRSYPFREDEAVYSFWALHLWQVDPLALTVWPDKPPLFLWLLGAAFSLVGPSETAARLVSISASILTVAVVTAIARTVWGHTAGLTAAVVFALSPFAISFAPTAYTDTFLVLCGALALYAAVTSRAIWAGIWFGAAVVTKQQGLLFGPLVAGALCLYPYTSGVMPREHSARAERSRETPARDRRREMQRLAVSLLQFAGGLVLVLLPVLIWDSVRWQVAPSPWDLSVQHYGGLSFLAPGRWWGRLLAWRELLWYLVGSWTVLILLLLAAILGTLRGGGLPSRGPYGRAGFVVLIGLWSSAFLAFHVVSSVEVWDRYLLPLAVPLALLAGCAFQAILAGRTPPGRRFLPAAAVLRARLLAVALCMAMLPPAAAAAQGQLPIGGDHGDYSGLQEVHEWLQQNAPAGSILYHRALGWHYRFYFFDAGEPDQNRFDLRWYPHEVYLANNAAMVPHRNRFLVQPDWRPLRRAERDLSVRGLTLDERLQAGKFTVYEVNGPQQDACAWCRCIEPVPLHPDTWSELAGPGIMFVTPPVSERVRTGSTVSGH